MGVVYMTTVIFDFIIFPLLWGYLVYKGILTGDSIDLQWSPITLSAGGFYHIAMGAVLGISALTRGQEKIERLRTSSSDGGYTELEQ